MRLAGAAFGVLALGAGVLQILAYVHAGYPRHLIVGIFAVGVGLCVLAAACSPRSPRWPR